MHDKNNGGPAFPCTDQRYVDSSPGMTLRDYFAAKAMQALVFEHRRIDRDDIAVAAYRMADTMLRVRNQA